MKKILSVSLLVAVIIGFSACEDHEPPVFFQIEVEETYNPSPLENWVILHDKDGELIEARQFTSGENLTFRSENAPERLSVTLLTYYGNQNYGLQTFHNEQSNTTWTLRGPAQVSTGPQTAQMRIIVSDPNLGSPYDATVSDGRGISLQLSESATDFVRTIPSPHADLDYFIAVTNASGTPMYKFLNAPVAGDNNYTLNDFSTFDHTAAINFPQTTGFLSYVLAFGANQYPDPNNVGFGYMTNLHWSGTFTGIPKTSNTLGFLNLFPNYFIFTTASYGSHTLNHESFGPAPATAIDIPNDINVTVTNSAWDAYELSSTDFDWYGAQYTSSIDTPTGDVFRSWLVRSNDIGFKNLKEFPEAIQTRFPDLSVDDFSYATTNIYKSNRTYGQYLGQSFKGDWGTPYADRYKTVF
jgi:hypothetical protein